MRPNLRLSCYWRGTHRRCRQVPWILETGILVPVWWLTPPHPAHSLDRMKPTSVCSVISDSVIPTVAPARLLCPWNIIGKKTVTSCHFLMGSSQPRDRTHITYIDRKILYQLHHLGQISNKPQELQMLCSPGSVQREKPIPQVVFLSPSSFGGKKKWIHAKSVHLK